MPVSYNPQNWSQRMVRGGKNHLGFARPDTYLMRGSDNEILEPFREQVGESTKKLGEYGATLGDDVDSRAKLQMGDAYKKLESQAMGTGDLESTGLMRQQLNRDMLRDAGRLNAQNMGQFNQTQSQMAMRGGVSGGASERMARSAMRNNMQGQQGLQSQFRDQNLQLSINNADNRNAMLRDVGQVQNSNNQYNASAYTNNFNRQLDALQRTGAVEQDVMRSNIGAARDDLNYQNLAAHNIYKEDMAAYGAQKQADATGKSGGKSGCCFIFLEARYGNGTMDEVVRRFRDENMTEKNKRGYYKLSEVLVPLMRRHSLVKLATRLLMTDPLVSYGKAHYGGSKLGFIFKPLVKFWLNTFDFLGGDHEFIRENGELI